MNARVKAVFFDLGGVIVNDSRLKKRLYEVFAPVEPARIWHELNEISLSAWRGEHSLADRWRNLARKFDLELDESIVESLWIDDYADNIEIDSEVLGIARDLASRYSIGIISNTIVEHSTILRSLGVFDDFHDVILSHDERMTKDNPALFDIALKRLKVDAIEAIFIDDLLRFADVAASRGIQTVLFENATRLREALSNLGVEVNV